MTVVHGDSAAKLLSLTIALDVEADRLDLGLPPQHDTAYLIGQGRTLVASMGDRGEVVDSGLPTIHLLHAGAEFMRAWARHDAELRVDLIAGAERLESLRDMAIATKPRADA